MTARVNRIPHLPPSPYQGSVPLDRSIPDLTPSLFVSLAASRPWPALSQLACLARAPIHNHIPATIHAGDQSPGHSPCPCQRAVRRLAGGFLASSCLLLSTRLGPRLTVQSPSASDPTLPVALVLCCAGFALASPRAVRCQHPPAFGSPAARVRQSWWLAEPAGNSRAVSRARYQYPAPAYRELVTYPIGQRPGGSRGPSDEPTANGRRRRRPGPEAEAEMHLALFCA